MLTLYFSGTGNTEYIARLFSDKMDAICLSIEANHDFSNEIKNHDTVAFCYTANGKLLPKFFQVSHLQQPKVQTVTAICDRF